MISTQPIGIHNYLTLKKTYNKNGVDSSFYSSWEDALWDLVEIFSIPKNAKILIPSFYCMDVIENMKSHHLEPIYYPMNKYFQTSPKIFNQLLKKHKPQIVVILNPVGITNQLLTQFLQWKQSLPHSCILIEDCVHQVINPNDIHFISKRHFIIDSLRKVVPLTGSNLFHQNELVLSQSKKRINIQTNVYKYRVFLLWVYFQILLTLGSISPNSKFKYFLFLQAEKIMQRGYDLTGDSYNSATGLWLMHLLAKFINHKHISDCKVKQVNVYLDQLMHIQNSPHLFFFPIRTTDFGQLRGFPLGVYSPHASTVITEIRKHGILVKSELDGCPWTEKHKVFYLPLGPHLSLADIENVCEIVRTVVKKL